MTDSKLQMPLSQAIESIIHSKLVPIHTWAPGIVQSYDEDNQTVDVQIVFKRLYDDADEAEEVSLLKGVRVVYPGNETYSMTVDVNKGTHVMLLFAMRCLDNYMTTGEVSDPRKNRMMSVSDAVALVGMQPDPLILDPPVDSNCIALRKNDNTVNVKVQSDRVEVNSGTTRLSVDGSKVEVVAGNTRLTVDAQEVVSDANIRGREIRAYNYIPLPPNVTPGYVPLAKHVHLSNGPAVYTSEPLITEPGPP